MMRVLEVAFLASAATIGIGPAMAADLVVHDPGMHDLRPGFDWDGAYANLSAYGGVINFGAGSGYGLMGTIGFGATSDMFYYGAEATGVTVSMGPVNTLAIEGDLRLGVLLGDDVLLYGVVGAGFVTAPVDLPHGILGAGVEFAVTDSMTIRAQYQADMFGSGIVGHFGKAGLSWYF